MKNILKINWIRRTAMLVTMLLLCVVSQLAGQAPAPVDAAAAGRALQPPHQKAALIKLHGDVDDMMLRSLERRVDLARKAGCTLIIYEMNTYGGFVGSALEISKFTRQLPKEKLATVAWVHDKAYSSGAIISASCQQIVISRDGVLGLCAPIKIEVDPTGLRGDKLHEMAPEERNKEATPILKDLDESAKANGYPVMLLHAMVTSEIEVHEMRSETGEVRFVNQAGKEALLAEAVQAPDGAKRHPWRWVKKFHPLLTVNPEEAIAMQLAKARIDDEAQLRAALNIQGDLIPMDFSWAEIAFVWLTQIWVRTMLFLTMLVLVYIELSHPGISVAGIGALICLILLIIPPFLTGLAQVWEISLIVIGLALVVLDLFIFGGIGLLAIPGLILMLIGLIASFVPSEPGGGFFPKMQSTWDALAWGTTSIAGSLVAAMFIFYFLSHYLRLTPGFRRIQLAPAGGHAPKMSVEVLDVTERSASDAVFIGAIGGATSDLRPAGKARFGEHLLDVMTQGEFVSSGAEVEVVEIAGSRIVVKSRKGH